MLRLGEIFQSGMVLQRGKKVRVWGIGDPGKMITISIQERCGSILVAEDGRWVMELDSLEASFDENMKVSDGEDTIIIDKIAVGEVWIAAGQSNMEFSMYYEKHFAEELESCEDEYLRFFDVPKLAYEGQREQFDYSCVGIWRNASRDNLKYFSAVGYYFAKELRKNLNVPVAFIGCNWGGTSIMSWLSRKSMEKAGKAYLQSMDEKIAGIDLEKYYDDQRKNPNNNHAYTLDDEFSHYVMSQTVTLDELNEHFGLDDSFWEEFESINPEAFPGILYENMVRTIIGFSVQGTLWYQGESDDIDDARDIYDDLLKALISEWRHDWNDPQMPFLIVQLPGFRTWIGLDNFDYATIREKQRQVAMGDSNVWMCSISDIGEEYDIHPKEKREVGYRLALQARNHIYGEDVFSEAPVGITLEREDNTLVVVFENAANGLMIKGDEIGALEVMSNGKQIPYDASVSGNKLFISIKEETEYACTVGFAQGKWYRVNLYNSAGIPAIPFLLFE